MSVVPEDWTLMIGQHRAAMVARDQMRDPAATQTMRDEATARYSRAADAVIEHLSVLSERHVLGNLTMHLARKERS
jgi:hypothetical protein